MLRRNDWIHGWSRYGLTTIYSFLSFHCPRLARVNSERGVHINTPHTQCVPQSSPINNPPAACAREKTEKGGKKKREPTQKESTKRRANSKNTTGVHGLKILVNPLKGKSCDGGGGVGGDVGGGGSGGNFLTAEQSDAPPLEVPDVIGPTRTVVPSGLRSRVTGINNTKRNDLLQQPLPSSARPTERFGPNRKRALSRAASPLKCHGTSPGFLPTNRCTYFCTTVM